MAYAPRNRVFAPAAITTPCVSSAEMRAHLRLTGEDERALIESFALAGQRIVERRTQRLLSRRLVTLSLPGLPTAKCPVELPGGEVASVSSVTADGLAIADTTFIGDSPALLIPAVEWPILTGEGYPVVVVYQAGFAATPADLKAAVMLLAAELFERRSNGEAGPLNEVPVSAHYLMEPWRIRPI